MSMIRVYGEGVRVGIAEITDKQVREFSSGAYGPDDFMSMEDVLPIQWTACGIIEDATIEVDNKILDVTIRKPHQIKRYDSKPIAKKGKNLFVAYHVLDGAWLRIKSSSRFDAAKLKSNTVEYIFPSGRGFGLNEVSYDGFRTEGALTPMWKAYSVYTSKGEEKLAVRHH